MDLSPRLGLPYIAPQQAQKHVTHNEAIRALDVLVQPVVKSRTIATPPGSPASGDTYIVAPSATGAWAGKDGTIATYVDGGWDFITPADGWLAYIDDTAQIAVCKAGAWSAMVTTGGSTIAQWGVNTAADLTNRLAVAADASLFTHDGTSHRLKINKSAAAETASVLFQDGFVGHAEFGLTGDDDFRLKVSNDGSTWFDALAVARTSGGITIPSGQLGFPATQNASSDPHVLDDYEEGTWLPRIDGTTVAGAGTYGAQGGNYTKIGNVVTVTGFCSISAHTGTGNMIIANLPFPQDASAAAAVVNLRVSSVTHAAGDIQAYVSGSTIVLETEASGGSATALPMDTNCIIRFSVTYFA